MKGMMYAMIVLLLAWSLGATTGDLGTDEFLGAKLGDTLSPWVLPSTVFLLGAAIAFATGTSWGTMGILMPIAFPVTWAVLTAQGVADPVHHPIMLSSIACVLAGAVWGDHCSPISDTTILSSVVSGCDHVDHVRTQLPYAACVGAVALIVGTVPTALGLPWWISLLVGTGVLYAILRAVGRDSAEPTA